MATIKHEEPDTAEEEEQFLLMAIQASLADVEEPAGHRPPPPSPQHPQPPRAPRKRAHEPKTVEYTVTDYDTMVRAWQIRFGVDIGGEGAIAEFFMWWDMMKGTLDLGEITDVEFGKEVRRRERIWKYVRSLLKKDDEEKEKRKRARIVRVSEGGGGMEKIDPRLRYG